MTVTFFGHRDTPSTVKSVLKDTLTDLIENKGADLFYLGKQGCFDRYATSVLKELQPIYPHIKFFIVLAYLPVSDNDNCFNTVFPEGIETVPKKFAISYRNRWMIDQSDTVVVYVTHSFGGAAQFAELAIKKKKAVINISQSLIQTKNGGYYKAAV